MNSDKESSSENEDDGDDDEQTDKKTVGAKRGRADDESYGVSRGVDFRGVQFVINVDFPKSVRAYTHRIGRTARGGASGTALSLVSKEDAKEERALKRVQAKQQAVRSETNDVIAQPAELAFDLKEIDCFRYRVEDVRRAVTRVAVREAQLADVKKEMLNSERLAAHFQANPRDLNMLEHDKVVGSAPVQPHLATIPDYLVPIELQPPAPARTKKKHNKHNKRQRLADGKRRTDNDPLHTFVAPDADDDKKQTVEDRISYGNSGVGKSTAGRQKWKKQHRKGHFNPKTIAKKKYKMSRHQVSRSVVLVGKRRTDNDPLHTFVAPDADDDKKQTVEDRISYGNSGVGKSTAGRQKWKKQHRKGHFNPKTIAKKKYKMIEANAGIDTGRLMPK
ncbi:DEAD/DEAH box RNA helicase [Phytophthora palmivora]|uniref:DEAD/DEAH box RNA helicase n=1 Tax=Phytophthora palmivora TaxID=4796 RepID=A0A2P4WWL1_9STRA|nr:DEAD/DEAH box RNA helicase [Phytophthora palmivora]